MANNRLITLMTDGDRDALHFELVSLDARSRIEVAHNVSPYVYFFESGFASIEYRTSGRFRCDVAVVGKEGCSGSSTILGCPRSASSMMVQVEGDAYRTPASALAARLDVSKSLRSLLLGYVHSLQVQRDEAMLAISKGNVLQRLARCLLLCHDRLEHRSVPLTHDTIAFLLGVRRASVTAALNTLQTESTVDLHRSDINILNRQRLVEICRPFYGGEEREFGLMQANAGAVDTEARVF